jgi:NAD(P)-dependent dehydrogenase (short-subunit alcohol dehydrogenase family)
MSIVGKAVLVTGANRGIGNALVEEALSRGAERVYAGSRQVFSHSDPRVTPLTLDITDTADIERAVGDVGSLDILINNAGVAVHDDLSNRSVLERHLAVNLFGTYAVIRSFVPLLAQSRGAIVNNLSLNALAALPILPAYSISKAAAFSLTQSLRAVLAPEGVRIHAVLTGPVDTDMNRGLDIPKAPTQSVAKGIFDGVEADQDEIFPDPVSRSVAERWYSGPAKALEQQFAALIADAEPGKSQAPVADSA